MEMEETMLMEDSKLADWDDDNPQAVQDTSSRWDKVVILKHMFTLKELEVRPHLLQCISNLTLNSIITIGRSSCYT